MAKTGFGEYITFAVVLRRFWFISCPQRGTFVRKGKDDDEIASNDRSDQLS